ncbi:hypothetical protein DICA3_C04720 [Diutina catenulata]
MSVDPITCHILDTTKGKPAAKVLCQLFRLGEVGAADTIAESKDVPEPVAMAHTDGDGRVKNWTLNPKMDDKTKQAVGIESNKWTTLTPGIYKIKFLTGKYFLASESSTFFPFVDIHFIISSPPDNHYHIPLLLSNHSYTTYRGS